MGGAPASATWMGSRSTVTLSETWLGSVLDMLEGFLKKANKSEFNSLQTGPNGLCLWPKVEAEMSKTCAAAISYKSGR
jgi:hypothetical protein